MQQSIYIKGMVCQRCINTVTSELKQINMIPDEVSLGEVKLSSSIVFSDYDLLTEKLSPLGFTVLENKKLKLIKLVKDFTQKVYSGNFDFPEPFLFSAELIKHTDKSYDLISQFFSEEEGITIEKYVIDQRIKKTRELLSTTELTLYEIAFKLGFSSTAHLSRQFKQHTGITPSDFKSLQVQK